MTRRETQKNDTLFLFKKKVHVHNYSISPHSGSYWKPNLQVLPSILSFSFMWHKKQLGPGRVCLSNLISTKPSSSTTLQQHVTIAHHSMHCSCCPFRLKFPLSSAPFQPFAWLTPVPEIMNDWESPFPIRARMSIGPNYSYKRWTSLLWEHSVFPKDSVKILTTFVLSNIFHTYCFQDVIADVCTYLLAGNLLCLILIPTYSHLAMLTFNSLSCLFSFDYSPTHSTSKLF